MAAQVKMEPQDIKVEPADSTVPGSPKKKKSVGRPKKLKQEKITDHMTVTKKKRDRFKGMSEEEVMSRLLPDHLAEDLDIVIVGINPGLFAAFVGHHYAGPGNHFWKCMFLSGLIPEQMNAMQDFKLLDYGIGFTNIVARTTRGSADLTKKEIKEGGQILVEKLRKYRPKIAAFNGKGIYEVFCGHKNFHFGKQPDLLEGTQTAVYVMPSSSARCSQLPRAIDKVPFYTALKKFRDYLKGDMPGLDHSEIVFPDLELKTAVKKEPKTEPKDQDAESQDSQNSGIHNAQLVPTSVDLSQFTQGSYQVIPHLQNIAGPSDAAAQTGAPPPTHSIVKQEPGLYNQSACSNSQSQQFSNNFNGQTFSTTAANQQWSSSLQGMFGLINQVASQGGSQVDLAAHAQSASYSHALYDIVKEEKTDDDSEYGVMSGSGLAGAPNNTVSLPPVPSTSMGSQSASNHQSYSLTSMTPVTNSYGSQQNITHYPFQATNPAYFPHMPNHGQAPFGSSQHPGFLPYTSASHGYPGNGACPPVSMSNVMGVPVGVSVSVSQGQANVESNATVAGQSLQPVIKQEKPDDGYPGS